MRAVAASPADELGSRYLQEGTEESGGCSNPGRGGNAENGERDGGGDGDGQSDRRGLDGVGGDGGDQSAGADGDAAFGEEFAQAFDGAADALLRGVVAHAEGVADFAEGFVLEIAEQDGGAVGVVERVHGFVEQRFDVRPVGGGGVHGVQGVELGGDLFAQLAAGFAADDINGGAAGDLIEPRGEDGVGRRRCGVAGEVGEDGLGDFLGELRGADLAKRGGIGEVHMALYEHGEGFFGFVPRIVSQEVEVACHHLQVYRRREGESDNISEGTCVGFDGDERDAEVARVKYEGVLLHMHPRRFACGLLSASLDFRVSR